MSHDDRHPSRLRLPRLLPRGARHEWSQQHLSHYVDGDLNWLARRRLELHAEECPECSLGIRALRSLVRLMHGAANRPSEPAPASIFDRVRADAAQADGGSDPAVEA
ncbi:MAG: anti-sigma factor family protein [Solirubrobacteraceae bacterium]